MNYGYEAIDQIEMRKVAISIEKPDDVTNIQFLSDIQNCMKELNEDIMFRYININDKKNVYQYYKTNNTDDFLHIYTKDNNIKVKRNEVIANSANSTNRLYSSNLLQVIQIYNFLEAEKFDLSNSIYYVDKEQGVEISEFIKNNGYNVVLFSGEYFSQSIYLGGYFLFFSLIIVASLVFYFLNQGKNFLIKKMEGYSNLNILCYELIRYLKNSFIILCCFFGLNLLFTIFVREIVPIYYIYYYVKNLVLTYFICIILFLLTSIILWMMNSVEYLKGKVKKRAVYFISIGLKLIFVTAAMFLLSFMIEGIKSNYFTMLSKRNIKYKCKDYVVFPINVSQNTFEGLENNYYSFYLKTVDKYNGILVDASNYKTNLLDGTNLAETDDQDYINVNRNYLSFNEIHDLKGDVITQDKLSNKQYNILIPQCKINEKDKYKQWIKDWYSTDVNFIIYKDNDYIYTYNAEVSTNKNGNINNPVILVFDEKLEYDFLLSYFSKCSYFIKATTDKPYEEFYGLLKECGIDRVTLEAPYLSSNYDNYFNEMLYLIFFYAIHSLGLILSVLILLFFTSKTFIENEKDRIVCSRLEGYNLLECCMDHYLLNFILYALVIFINSKILSIFPIKLKIEIFLLSIIIEFILTSFLLKRQAKKKIVDMLKGA